jgi:hypothetical protein
MVQSRSVRDDASSEDSARQLHQLTEAAVRKRGYLAVAVSSSVRATLDSMDGKRKRGWLLSKPQLSCGGDAGLFVCFGILKDRRASRLYVHFRPMKMARTSCPY